VVGVRIEQAVARLGPIPRAGAATPASAGVALCSVYAVTCEAREHSILSVLQARN
jgi:hypothetical protein